MSLRAAKGLILASRSPARVKAPALLDGVYLLFVTGEAEAVQDWRWHDPQLAVT